MINSLGQFMQGHQYWLGKKREPFSDEWKKNLSLNHRKTNSAETRRKIGDANRGKKITPELRIKWSNAQKGKKMSEKTKRKLSEAFKGEKNHQWKGGVTSVNKVIRHGLEYKTWQVAVLERDKFLCQMPDCDKQEHYLEVHHIKTFSKYPELRFDLNNGITLCKNCHHKTKHKEELFESMFIEIIKLK